MAEQRPLSGNLAGSAWFPPAAGMRHNLSLDHSIPTDRFQRLCEDSHISVFRTDQGAAEGEEWGDICL
jgi:hypothetical protein